MVSAIRLGWSMVGRYLPEVVSASSLLCATSSCFSYTAALSCAALTITCMHHRDHTPGSEPLSGREG